jgi:hypothetical protein
LIAIKRQIGQRFKQKLGKPENNHMRGFSAGVRYDTTQMSRRITGASKEKTSLEVFLRRRKEEGFAR